MLESCYENDLPDPFVTTIFSRQTTARLDGPLELHFMVNCQRFFPLNHLIPIELATLGVDVGWVGVVDIGFGTRASIVEIQDL